MNPIASFPKVSIYATVSSAKLRMNKHNSLNKPTHFIDISCSNQSDTFWNKSGLKCSRVLVGVIALSTKLDTILDEFQKS